MARGLLMAGSFGRRLKEMREQAGMTQEALARSADLSVSSVSKLEQRDLDPSWSTVQALAKALGQSCEAFNDPPPEDVDAADDEPPPRPISKRK